MEDFTCFAYDDDPIFNNKISGALSYQCKSLASINADFKKISIYIKQDKEIAGGVIAYIHGKIIWLDSIYVEEIFQNRGLGNELIIKLVELAKKHDIREIQLNTYFPKALQFFKKCGFDEVAVVPNWKYNMTCYMMKKIIL